jgi:beta-fructofuranosidase
MEPDFTARRKTGKFPLRICIRSTLAVFLAALPLATAAPASPNEAIQRAMASVTAATPRAEANPTRPLFHVAPPAFWNNDPNGPLYHRGWYHLFYQHNPYGDDWGNMHWGHVRSRDLARWEHLPIALWPSKELGEDHVFSGCAVLAKGRPMIFYTSIGRGKGADVHAEQWAALGSDDLLTWQKHPANPILTEALHGHLKVYDWRDPFHFEHEGRHYLVLGGNLNQAKGGQAVVLLYEALNDGLTQWKYRGELFRHPDPRVKDIECPNFFQLGQKWVLIVSPYGRVEYFVGDFDPAKGAFQFQTRGLLDHGDQFYAPNTLLNQGKRRLLWGWVRGFKSGQGWNGCLTVPRDLSLDADGNLRQQPAPELKKLRGPGVRQANVRLTDTVMAVPGVRGSALELEVEFEPGAPEKNGLNLEFRSGAGAPASGTPVFGLKIRRPRGDARDLRIAFDGQQLDVAGAKAPFELKRGEGRLRLRVFVDRSVLEVFANGRECVTRVVEAVDPEAQLELFATGGSATVRSLSAWPVRSIGG